MSPTFEDTLRSIVREVVREELRDARPAALRNAEGDGGYLSISAAAKFAAVAPGTLRRWIRSGRLPTRRAGRVYRIGRTELVDFLARGGRSADVATRARAILTSAP